MPSGIYAIVNTANSKLYVGSSINLERRRLKHFVQLRAGKHPSKHLQASFNKYGGDVFQFKVLQELAAPSFDDLLACEQHWIDTLLPAYNKRTVASSNRGLRLTGPQKAKQSASLREWNQTPEGKAHVAARAARNAELWADPEHREARLAAIRAAWTPEKREAFGRAVKARQSHIVDGVHFGTHRIWTDEERQRSGEAQKARWAERVPVSEDDIRKLVSDTNPSWTAKDMTGVRSQDKVLIFCSEHNHEQWQAIAKLRHSQRGCKLCGYKRSSEKQLGRAKQSKSEDSKE